MFNWSNLELRYDPYPIGLIKPLMSADQYAECLKRFPEKELFRLIHGVGTKYSLSEKFNPRAYRKTISTDPFWKEFHSWVKSPEFILGTLTMLREHQIDLGYRYYPPTWKNNVDKIFRDLAKGKTPRLLHNLRARFEFSMLPLTGEGVLPHTDNPNKIVTYVISVLDEDEWDPAYRGGTNIIRPKNGKKIYDYLNNHDLGYEDTEVIDTYEFTPNQAVIFVKTFNSWHSVLPMQSTDRNKMRRTLTINIEVER